MQSKHKLINILIGIILLASLIYAVNFSGYVAFSNELGSENLTFNKSEYITRFVDIPLSGYVENLTFLLDGYNNSIDYKFYRLYLNQSGGNGAQFQWGFGGMTGANGTGNDTFTPFLEGIENSSSPDAAYWVYTGGVYGWKAENFTNLSLPMDRPYANRNVLVSATAGFPIWIQVNLTKKVFVKSFGLGGHNAPWNIYEFTIEGSNDNINFMYILNDTLRNRATGEVWYYNVSDFPTDVFIEVGDLDGNYEWSLSSILNVSTNTSLNITPINNILGDGCICKNCTIIGGICRVPLTFHSVSPGILSIDNINLTYSFDLDNCSIYNNHSINFSIYEETNLTSLNADTEAVIDYWWNSSDKYNFTFTAENEANFSICIYPAWANLTIDAYLKYETDNGFRERYYLENLYITNTTQFVNMYNFNTQTGISELKATVKDNIYDEIAGIIMKLQRYYVSEDIWRTVQIDRSDQFGRGVFYVIENTADYRFVFESGGAEIDRSAAVKYICDAGSDPPCEDEFILIGAGAGAGFSGMTGWINYNNVTGIVTFTWNDPSNTATTVRFLVEKQASDRVVTICNIETSTSSGSINCDISGYDGLISARAFRASSPDVAWLIENIEERATQLYDIVNSDEGMMFSNFLSMTLIGFGAATGSPLVVIVMGIASMIFVFLLGINSVIDIAFVIGIFAVGIVVAFMIGGKK